MTNRDIATAIDISSFVPTDKTTIEILTPDGRKTGWFVELAGPAHAKTLELSDRLLRRNLDRQREIEQLQFSGRRYQGDETSPEENRRENVRNLVARIIDWTPVSVGKIYEFSPAAAEELLSKPEMGWAYTQISEALGDLKRFTKRSDGI